MGHPILDLTPPLIVPCGIRERGVTSVERLLRRPLDLGKAMARLAFHFAADFDRVLQ